LGLESEIVSLLTHTRIVELIEPTMKNRLTTWRLSSNHDITKTFGIILALTIITACEDKSTPTLPLVTTNNVTEISAMSAVSGGIITNDGGAAIVLKGICWNTIDNPTVADSKTSEGGESFTFTSNLSQLLPNTTYYVRAYATNSAGTSYGNSVSFITRGSGPTLITSNVSSITHIHAFCSGTITSDGGIPTTSRGVCWSTSPNPTISNNKTSDLFGLSPGYFPSFISGLNANTTYYVRAYGTNSSGTGYGQQVQFVTLTNYTGQTGTINDNDGNSYQTIGIGSQVWMAENLKTTKFNDGVAIQNVTGDGAWAVLTTPAYCIYNNDALNLKPTYGVLYNWHTLDAAANGNRNVCPTAWHVPSDEEWTTLKNYLGESVSGSWSFETLSTGANIAGKMLKETGTLHWLAPNTATNETGFKALPGGFRNSTGFFNYIGRMGYWWSSTKQNWGNMDAYFNSIYYDNSVMSVDPGNRSYGLSVRCVKD